MPHMFTRRIGGTPSVSSSAATAVSSVGAVIAEAVATDDGKASPPKVKSASPTHIRQTIDMLDALRRRSASYNASHPPPQSSAAAAGLAALPQPKLKPYEVPLADGRCYLAELPSEILTRIFLKLDRASLTKSYRVSLPLNVLPMYELISAMQRAQRVPDYVLSYISAPHASVQFITSQPKLAHRA